MNFRRDYSLFDFDVRGRRLWRLDGSFFFRWGSFWRFCRFRDLRGLTHFANLRNLDNLGGLEGLKSLGSFGDRAFQDDLL